MTDREVQAVAVPEERSERLEIDIQAVSADARAFAGAPYPGLRAFRRDESRLFFGRDACVDQMVDRLAETRFLAVLGSSGSGKSSLVRTGLYDALKLGLHPRIGGRWQFAEFNPGRKPMFNLARALIDSGGDYPGDADLLTSHLRRGPRAIAEVAQSGIIRKDCNLLIVCDQFEELFRYRNYGDREETEAFVALLLETTRGDVPVHVVLTMRSEYLSACAQIPNLAEQISNGLYLTPRMTRTECQQAIEGPSVLCHFTLTDDLVARLLNDLQTFSPFEQSHETDQTDLLAHQADQLPLMQHVLNRIWRRAVQKCGLGRVVIQLPDYDDVGGLTGAINTHGREVVSALEKAHGPRIKKSIERVFRALVEGPTLSLAVRRPRPVAELVAAGGDARNDVISVIEAFRASDCNFLRTSDDALDDKVVVDIVHESLIRRWEDLAGWFLAEMEANRMWQRLAYAAEDHRPNAPAWARGSQLQRFVEWWQLDQPVPFSAKRYGHDFDRLQDFLKGSENETARLAREAAEKAARLAREAEERAQEATRKVQRRVIGIVAVATVVLIYALFVTDQRNELARERDAIAQDQKKIELQTKELDAAFSDMRTRAQNLQVSLARLCAGTAGVTQQRCAETDARLAKGETISLPEASGRGAANPGAPGYGQQGGPPTK